MACLHAAWSSSHPYAPLCFHRQVKHRGPWDLSLWTTSKPPPGACLNLPFPVRLPMVLPGVWSPGLKSYGKPRVMIRKQLSSPCLLLNTRARTSSAAGGDHSLPLACCLPRKARARGTFFSGCLGVRLPARLPLLSEGRHSHCHSTTIPWEFYGKAFESPRRPRGQPLLSAASELLSSERGRWMPIS